MVGAAEVPSVFPNKGPFSSALSLPCLPAPGRGSLHTFPLTPWASSWGPARSVQEQRGHAVVLLSPSRDGAAPISWPGLSESLPSPSGTSLCLV